jgi:hypothetical protein
MNIVKFHVRKILGLNVAYYYPRAPVAAATHLPVLIGLARLFPIRTILEFGAGSFSTLAFLDRRLFPLIEHAHSLETNPEWKQRIESQTASDQRLTIELIDAKVQQTAAVCNYTAYDLVFVDNGPARAETIKEVIARRQNWGLAIIHDFEILAYQQAARAARHKFCFDAYCPHTAVFWNQRKLGFSPGAAFRRMNKAFNQHAKLIQAEDIEQWTDIVGQLVPRILQSAHWPQ